MTRFRIGLVVAVAALALLLWEMLAPRPFHSSRRQRETALERAGDGRVGLVLHAAIEDPVQFGVWRVALRAAVEAAGGERRYGGDVDPVAWQGSRIDAILIDELPSADAAREILESAIIGEDTGLSALSVLAVQPRPKLMLAALSAAAQLAHWVAPIETHAGAAARPVFEPAPDSRIWSTPETLQVALAQDQDAPLFMYNLNKVRERALYLQPIEEDPNVSGQEAYERYGPLPELLRRGAHPFYMATVLGLVVQRSDDPLWDEWSDFILVRYPQRRILVDMLTSADYAARRHHREAALERASLRFTTPWPEFAD